MGAFWPARGLRWVRACNSEFQQLERTPGLLAFTLGTDDGCRVARSIAIWESEEAMLRYVTSGAHAEAMTDTLVLSDTGKATHWWATPEELDAIDWDLAEAKLAAEPESPIYE